MFDAEILTQFKEIFFIAGGALAAGIISYLKGILGTKKVQENGIQMSVDKLGVQIGELNNRVQITEANLEAITYSLSKLSEAAKKDEFRHKLKVIISDTVNSILISDEDMHEDVRSLIIESEHHTYEFFKNIYYIGFDNMDINLVKEKALQVFRMLRRLKEPGITDEMALRMQEFVAYPAINHLAQKLIYIKNKKYNGHTDNKFIDAAIEYVVEVCHGAIRESKK